MTASHYEWSWGGPLPTLRRHSEVKHALLRDYLVEYFLTLVSDPRQDRIQLTVVDGFCGGGRYVSEGGLEVPGSPLVILDAIKEAQARLHQEQQRRKPIEFDVKLLCVDEDSGAVGHLGHVLDAAGHGAKLRSGAITLLVGDFVSHAEAAIAEAGRRSPRAGRALFVLDQYGYDAVPVDSLQAIFTRLARAEVILTFNVDALLNFLCAKNLADFERKTGLVGAVTVDQLDARSRGPGWRLQLQSDLYQRLTQASGAKFFTPFFIRPAQGHGDFWLLHLSQHWKARDVMACTHWQHHNHFVHYGAAGFDMFSTGYATRVDRRGQAQAAFNFDGAANVASQDALKEQIPSALMQTPDGVSFEQFFLQRVNTTPATREMVEAALLELVRLNEVEVVDGDGSRRGVRRAIAAADVLRRPAQRKLFSGG